VYVEERAASHPNTRKILEKIKNRTVIITDHYKDVFSPRQNFSLQKHSQKLILAVKSGNFFYRGSPMCFDHGFDEFYYATNIMNCPYDCGYCYLSGLYPSANIVVFVNIEDTFDEIKKRLAGGKPFISVSNESDLLALEKLTGFAREWIRFASENKNVTAELRTKSVNFDSVADIAPTDNFIFAWSLSPEKYISEYEKKTPGLDARLDNIIRASDAGWRVRLCFDPLLYVPGCIEEYKNFSARVFNKLACVRIFDICAGPFRTPKAIIKKMGARNACGVLAYPFTEHDGLYTYRDDHIVELYDAIRQNAPDVPTYYY